MVANPVKISYLVVTRAIPLLRTRHLPFSLTQRCLRDHHPLSLSRAANVATEHTTSHRHLPRIFQLHVPTATQSLQDVPRVATQATAAPHAIIVTSTSSIAKYHANPVVTT